MPSDEIHKAIERASLVKLPGGIVGKTAYVLIAAALALGSMVVATKSETVAYVAIAALIVVVTPTLWRLIAFAEKHPDASLMEGAELLDLHRIKLAQKGIGELPKSLPEPADQTALLIVTDNAPDIEPVRPPKRRKRDG